MSDRSFAELPLYQNPVRLPLLLSCRRCGQPGDHRVWENTGDTVMVMRVRVPVMRPLCRSCSNPIPAEELPL